jgi:hypothetical protein
VGKLQVAAMPPICSLICVLGTIFVNGGLVSSRDHASFPLYAQPGAMGREAALAARKSRLIVVYMLV